MSFKKCTGCEAVIKSSIATCPNCESNHFVYGVHEDNPRSVVRMEKTGNTDEIQMFESNSQIYKLLEKNIEATNRTTHAIRAFVRFLFLQLSFTTVAIFLYNWATSSVNPLECVQSGDSCEPNAELILLAVVTWIIGVGLSSRIGWEELVKSDVPDSSR